MYNTLHYTPAIGRVKTGYSTGLQELGLVEVTMNVGQKTTTVQRLHRPNGNEDRALQWQAARTIKQSMYNDLIKRNGYSDLSF